MVLKAGQLLLGRRKGSHGEGEYAYPGGHLEHLETFAQCGAREVREETGLEIGPLRFLRLLARPFLAGPCRLRLHLAHLLGTLAALLFGPSLALGFQALLFRL